MFIFNKLLSSVKSQITLIMFRNSTQLIKNRIKIAFYKFNDVNDAEADIYMVFERIMSLQK